MSSAESINNKDFRARLLRSAKKSDPQAVANRFKQEDEFQASLGRTQKKKFGAEVRGSYENLLAESGRRGRLLES